MSSSGVSMRCPSRCKSMRRKPLAVLVAALISTGTVHSAEIVVTTASDGSVLGQCSLRAALEAARTGQAVNACSAGDPTGTTISFQEHLAYETILLTEGELLVNSVVSIASPAPSDAAGLTIDADGQSRLFNVSAESGETALLDLSGMTLTGGMTPEGAGNQYAGGAIRAGNADLVLKNVLITQNSTRARRASGAGIALWDGSLLLVDSVVSDNQTHGEWAEGGGVAITNGDLVALDSQIIGNQTFDDQSYGGGLFIHTGDAILVDSTIQDNQTHGTIADGAGVMIFFGNASLDESVVADNLTSGMYAIGGGLLVIGDLAISKSVISGNGTRGESAQAGGLAVFGELQIMDSFISENFTEAGSSHAGAIMVSSGPASIVRTSIVDNRTLGECARGAGFRSSHADVKFTNSTVSGNYVDGSCEAGSSITVWNGSLELVHTTVVSPPNQVGGTAITLGNVVEFRLTNSLLKSIGGSQVLCSEKSIASNNSFASDASCNGKATPITDFQLSELGINNGTIPTHAIASGSIARDAAGNCEAEHAIAVDQRGEPRPGQLSQWCDAGSFELQLMPLFTDRFQE